MNSAHKKAIRKILACSTDFKAFWSTDGPFRYAVTSKEFPPVLLEPEEWIFSDDPVALLKELMQFHQRKMAFVKSPFNIDRKEVFRPDLLAPWRIVNFCEEWACMACDLFTPAGHLAGPSMAGKDFSTSGTVEAAFFKQLENQMDPMGYVLLRPLSDSSRSASVHAYLQEWEEDETFLL